MVGHKNHLYAENAGLAKIMRLPLTKPSIDVLRARWGLIKRLFAAFHLNRLEIAGLYGFEDPSITGLLSGFIETFRYILPAAEINLTPNFNEPVLTWRLRARGRFYTGEIIRIILSFTFYNFFTYGNHVKSHPCD